MSSGKRKNVVLIVEQKLVALQWWDKGRIMQWVKEDWYLASISKEGLKEKKGKEKTKEEKWKWKEREKHNSKEKWKRRKVCMWKSEQSFLWMDPASFEVGFVQNCSVSTKSCRINKKRTWRGEPFLSLIRHLLVQIQSN